MNKLFQPIYSQNPERGHELKDVLTLEAFIQLLKEEEDYYPGEQNNTKLMITRLRKIFYDKWGWNKELIKGAATIESRYDVVIVDEGTEHTKEIRRFKKFHYDPKHRSVVYKSDDKVYGNTRAGQPTFIYSNDHQEVVLPDGNYCDIAHILAGIDAANYRQVVTPLPGFLSFLQYLLPYVGYNMDMATWLGDIGSSAGDFFFHYMLHKKPATLEEQQNYINIDVPGSDMLGNIDAYVINASYDVRTNKGMRFTEILEDYYFNEKSPRKKRITIFCQEVGLGTWNGNSFSNENQWMKYYKKQSRNESSFQVFSVTDEKIHSVWMPIVVWLGFYKDILKGEELLNLVIEALKEVIIKEM
jgi:hypothetical protein